MTRRFQNILRGYRGEAAKNKYLDRLRGMGQGENVGQGTKRPPSIKLYIEPFSDGFPGTILVHTSATVPAWTALSAVSAITARTKAAVTASDIHVRVKGFKASRVVRRSKADTTGTATTSKLTGLRYLKYSNPSVSVPFGRDNATDTFGAAKTAITNALTANGAAVAVTFIDEEN
jgi:hypothetical protein